MIFTSNLHVITRCFQRVIAWFVCVLGSEDDCAEQVQVLSAVSDPNDVDVSGGDSIAAMSQLPAATEQSHDNDFDRSVEGEHYWTGAHCLEWVKVRMLRRVALSLSRTHAKRIINASDPSLFVSEWNKENICSQAPSIHRVGKQAGKEQNGETKLLTFLEPFCKRRMW